MNKSISSFKDIEDALFKSREEFHKSTTGIKDTLKRSVTTYFEQVDLISNVASEGDDEIYTLEVLASAFRKVISSYILLESGLAHEAHAILRNALELMLVSIDITYNKESLFEWKNTIKEDLRNTNYNEWYFKKSKICKRLKENKNNLYPSFEIAMAIGREGLSGNGICKEWEAISTMSAHEHSQVQIKKLINDKGDFRLFARKQNEKYKMDFEQYAGFILNIVNILDGIPKYKELIGKSVVLGEKANRFVKSYTELLGGMNVSEKLIREKV